MNMTYEFNKIECNLHGICDYSTLSHKNSEKLYCYVVWKHDIYEILYAIHLTNNNQKYDYIEYQDIDSFYNNRNKFVPLILMYYYHNCYDNEWKQFNHFSISPYINKSIIESLFVLYYFNNSLPFELLKLLFYEIINMSTFDLMYYD